MKLAKNEGDAQTSASGLVSKGVEISGDILFAEELRVVGRVTGKVVSEKGSLVIEQAGRVEAQVEVGICVIRGTLNGDVKAQSRIEIYKTGRVRGDLSAPVLLVEEGAEINGSIGMGKAGDRLSEEVQPGDNGEKIQVKSDGKASRAAQIN
jgi:cytoskeletal protein CcmA (bactofilin family)